MTPIQCPACGHENETSRVFCQNCGFRLPKTEATKETLAQENKAAADKAAKVRREDFRRAHSKPFDWKDFLAGTLASAIKLAILGAILAAIILSARMPADIPPKPKEHEELVKAGDQQLQNALSSNLPANIRANQDLINSYLVTKVTLQGNSQSGLVRVRVSHPFIVLEPGAFRLGILYEIAGIPMVVQTRFLPRASQTGYTLDVVNGSVGRLPLPAWIFEKFLRWYEPLKEVLQTPLSILAKADTVNIRPPEAIVTWKPTSQTSATEQRSEPSGVRSVPLSSPSRPDAEDSTGNPLTR